MLPVVLAQTAATAPQGTTPSQQTTTNTTNIYYNTPAPAAAPAPAQPIRSLPCNANVINRQGVMYYQCGQDYYMQTFGSNGPVYMQVAPPA